MLVWKMVLRNLLTRDINITKRCALPAEKQDVAHEPECSHVC